MTSCITVGMHNVQFSFSSVRRMRKTERKRKTSQLTALSSLCKLLSSVLDLQISKMVIGDDIENVSMTS